MTKQTKKPNERILCGVDLASGRDQTVITYRGRPLTKEEAATMRSRWNAFVKYLTQDEIPDRVPDAVIDFVVLEPWEESNADG